jgi:hypothetical protein
MELPDNDDRLPACRYGGGLADSLLSGVIHTLLAFHRRRLAGEVLRAFLPLLHDNIVEGGGAMGCL